MSKIIPAVVMTMAVMSALPGGARAQEMTTQGNNALEAVGSSISYIFRFMAGEATTKAQAECLRQLKVADGELRMGEAIGRTPEEKKMFSDAQGVLKQITPFACPAPNTNVTKWKADVEKVYQDEVKKMARESVKATYNRGAPKYTRQ